MRAEIEGEKLRNFNFFLIFLFYFIFLKKLLHFTFLRHLFFFFISIYGSLSLCWINSHPFFIMSNGFTSTRARVCVFVCQEAIQSNAKKKTKLILKRRKKKREKRRNNERMCQSLKKLSFIFLLAQSSVMWEISSVPSLHPTESDNKWFNSVINFFTFYCHYAVKWNWLK